MDKVILVYYKNNYETDSELICVAENIDTAREYVNVLKKTYPYLYDVIYDGKYTGSFSYEEHDIVKNNG